MQSAGGGSEPTSMAAALATSIASICDLILFAAIHRQPFERASVQLKADPWVADKLAD